MSVNFVAQMKSMVINQKLFGRLRKQNRDIPLSSVRLSLSLSSPNCSSSRGASCRSDDDVTLFDLLAVGVELSVVADGRGTLGVSVSPDSLT